jgi:hypothetical protein
MKRGIFHIQYRYYAHGKASSVGTKSFLEKAQSPLHHRFHRSQLFISPFIFGPPRFLNLKNDPSFNAKNALQKCVLQNHSNCVYIYNNDPVTGIWHCNNAIDELIHKTKVERENLVLIADFGLNHSGDNVVNQFIEVKKLCHITNIDIVILKVYTKIIFFI